MRKPASHQPIMISLFAILFLLLGLPTHAQDGNLLQNPGFEPPFVTLDGQPPRQVATGWTPWHIPAPPGSPSFFNVQPEYYPTAPDTARIRSGADAQTILSFFAVHTGGVYQRVSGVAPGTTLRFTVYAYVWSSTFDDVNLSEDDGNVLVSVGIDPNGGTDPQSAGIVWSAPVEQYDAYNAYTIEAAAAGSAVTVFVRTTAGVPVKHNNIYVDDASLTGAGGPAATATATKQQPAPATNTAQPTVVPPPPATATTDSKPLPSPTPGSPDATIAPLPTLTFTPLPAPATSTPIPPLPTSTFIPPSPTPATPITDEFPYSIVHTVQRGDTLSVLAMRYGSTVQAIAAANGLTNNHLIMVGQELIIPLRTPPAGPPTATEPVVFVTATPPEPVPPLGYNNIYVVMPGDTLTRIARLFNTTVPTLAQLNGIVNVNQIQVGQQLIVPATMTQPPAPQPTTPILHIVLPGDTLQRIAFQYGRTIWDIARANNIQNINLIFIGQVLVIP